MSSVVITGDTSGSVTISAPAVAGTTTLTLPTANGTIITTGSSGQSIPKAALPTGSVLQVVSATYSGTVFNSTSTYADTGLTASITPTSATSKILVLISHYGYKSNDNSNNGVSLNLCRNGSQIIEWSRRATWTNTALYNFGNFNYNYLDSPATTSSTAYKTQFANYSNNAGVEVNSDSVPASIILMEISA